MPLFYAVQPASQPNRNRFGSILRIVDSLVRTKSLVAYGPAANTSTVLLGPPISHGGGVEGVRRYPREN